MSNVVELGMGQDNLKLTVESCIRQLSVHDRTLLEVDINERALSGQLAVYLSHCCQEWDVDVEYNRDRYEVKRVSGPTIVIPDIIIHRRNTGENLLAIEIKKTSNVNEHNRQDDRWKLERLREEYGYRYVLFLEIGVGTHTNEMELDWLDVE